MKKINFISVFAVAALLLSVSFTSCKTAEPDPYAGKTNPSTIAASNLVAYFPFESETASIELGTGVTYSKKGGAASFVTGRRGNAYKGATTQAYLEYTVASTNLFKSMTEFTMGAWIKTPAAGGAADIFQLNGGDSFMGNLVLMLEGGSNADSLDMKGYLFNSTTEWKGQDIRKQNKAFLSDKWVHVVYSYNKTTSTETLYANGLPVATSKRFAGPEAAGAQPALGAITFGTDMTKILIGSWPQQLDGTGQDWMRFYPGLLDELRIYNKALTDAEVKALYDAEITVIN
ncbi:MAG: LamG domain-containing protein [Paludibacter sp.]|nr:LamG domain-containing protein [Paludibacter sp.]